MTIYCLPLSISCHTLHDIFLGNQLKDVHLLQEEALLSVYWKEKIIQWKKKALGTCHPQELAALALVFNLSWEQHKQIWNPSQTYSAQHSPPLVSAVWTCDHYIQVKMYHVFGSDKFLPKIEVQLAIQMAVTPCHEFCSTWYTIAVLSRTMHLMILIWVWRVIVITYMIYSIYKWESYLLYRLVMP